MTNPTKLSGPFSIVILGDTREVARGDHASKSRGYLFDRLLRGEEADVGENNMRPWGLRVVPGDGLVGRATVRSATLEDAEAVLADLLSDPLTPEDALAIFNILLDRVIGEEG